MIGQKAGTLAGSQYIHCFHPGCSTLSRLPQHCGRPATPKTQTASPGLCRLLHTRKGSLQPCCAVDRDIGGYTPSDYITWSEDPKQQCHHHAEVVVDAPIDACFSLWMDWTKIIDFLDLIGQIGLDDDNPDMALLQCFYRWRRLPLMEIIFLLERTKVEPNKRIKFQTCYGMPMSGQVDFQELPDGQTRVKLYFTHGVPNLLVQLQVGPFGVETDLMKILKENLEEYKSLVEQSAPEDWQQQKQQVAAGAQQQQQPKAPKQQANQEQQQQEEPADQQQQGAQQEVSAAPATAGRKQRSSRKTAQATEAAAAVAPEAAEAPKSRGRPPTSRRTASKAAAAAAELFDSPSSAGTSRRSRASTAARADGDQQATGGRPGRRSTRKTATSVKEQ